MTEQTQMFLAKALYDNIAESPDELAFRRGDVLTVMEQNTSGLDGWWLCSLRGRQGIAPGNRLKILSGMVDGLSNGKTAGHQNDSELVAQKEWRRSLEKSPNKVVTPQKKGEVYVYKQPNRSMEDYDVPPSRYFPPSKESSPEPRGYDVYDTPNNRPAPAGSISLYDTPPSSKRASCERTPPGSHRASLDSNTSLGPARRLSGEQVSHTPPSSKRSSADGGVPVERHYETPPSSKRASLERILSDDNPTYDIPSSSKSLELPLSMSSSETAYDSPSFRRLSRDSTGTGNRASLLSTASTESCLSGSSSQLASNRLSAASASLPDSARSSLDASLHDAYDLPPREARALKQLSMDSGLGLYDTPANARARETSPQPPGHLGSSSVSHLTDLPLERPHIDIKRSRSLEHALDELYDLPRSNAPKLSLKATHPAFGSATSVNHDPSAVYDIPPQVTRDSVISARSDSSDESVRLSSCSVDSRGSGADYAGGAEGLYEELLLDLDSALELLVKLQQEVSRTSSRLLAFVSSTWRQKDSLHKRIYDIKVACVELNKALGEYVDFAQGTLANSARLSDKKLVSRLVRHVTPIQQHKQSFSQALRGLEEMKWQVNLLVEPVEPGASDDLGTIINLAKELVPDAKKLGSLIQGNSSLLFKRSSDFAAHSRNTTTPTEIHVASKPPIVPKPEGLPKQGTAAGNGVGGGSGGGTGVGGGTITFRARTLQQRPLPAPPTPERPLPPPPQHQYQQQQQKGKDSDLAGALDNLSDIAHKGEQSRLADDRDYTDLIQEYDYVQLEARDVAAQQQGLELQQKQQQQQSHQTQRDVSTVLLSDGQKILSDESGYGQSNKDRQKPPQHSKTVSEDDPKQLGDVDLVPTKECARIEGSVIESFSGLDMTDGELDEQELKTPVNLNGFPLPSPTQPPPRYLSSDFSSTVLEPSDKQVLVYYSGQLETHATLLTNAIDAFFTCIENNEPPKVFISNSKFVIVTAHKLVYISDALHRSLANCEVRNKVMHCANHMCECLKVSVQATKVAALQYPSVPAVQEMVDRVVDVSHAAHELKLVITQASAL